jgi:hypothetical protein
VADQAPAKASKAKASKALAKGGEAGAGAGAGAGTGAGAGAETEASTSASKVKSEVKDEGAGEDNRGEASKKRRPASHPGLPEGRMGKRPAHGTSEAMLTFWAEYAPDKLLEHNQAVAAAATADTATESSSSSSKTAEPVQPAAEASAQRSHKEQSDKGTTSTGKEPDKGIKDKGKKDKDTPMAPHCQEFHNLIVQLNIKPTYSDTPLPAWDHVFKWFNSPAGKSVFQQHMVHGIAPCDKDFLDAVGIKKPHAWMEALKAKGKPRGAWAAYNVKQHAICSDSAHMATTHVKGFPVDMALLSDRFAGAGTPKDNAKVGCLICSLRDHPPPPAAAPTAAASGSSSSAAPSAASSMASTSES